MHSLAHTHTYIGDRDNNKTRAHLKNKISILIGQKRKARSRDNASRHQQPRVEPPLRKGAQRYSRQEGNGNTHSWKPKAEMRLLLSWKEMDSRLQFQKQLWAWGSKGAKTVFLPSPGLCLLLVPQWNCNTHSEARAFRGIYSRDPLYRPERKLGACSISYLANENTEALRSHVGSCSIEASFRIRTRSSTCPISNLQRTWKIQRETDSMAAVRTASRKCPSFANSSIFKLELNQVLSFVAFGIFFSLIPKDVSISNKVSAIQGVDKLLPPTVEYIGSHLVRSNSKRREGPSRKGREDLRTPLGGEKPATKWSKAWTRFSKGWDDIWKINACRCPRIFKIVRISYSLISSNLHCSPD